LKVLAHLFEWDLHAVCSDAHDIRLPFCVVGMHDGSCCVSQAIWLRSSVGIT
jgi:hypothetical protein